MVLTATFSEVPSGCLRCPSITDPNSPVRETSGHYVHLTWAATQHSTPDCVLTFSQDFTDGQQVPHDHHVLEFGLKLTANAQTGN